MADPGEISSGTRRVGGYDVVAGLGQGGMGTVYKARRPGGTGLVALKVLSPSAVSEEMAARFRRESAVVAKLDHENIARCIEFGFDAARGCHFCAVELVEGETVGRKVSRGGPLAEGDAVRVAQGVARALAHAHANGLVHRDVKPAHVMVAADGKVKLLDLGLARATAEQRTLHLAEEGDSGSSPHYTSPEQATGGRDVDIRSDLYSLGAVMYFMATGKAPFAGGNLPSVLAGHLSGTIPWPSEANPSVSEGFSRVVAKLMAKDADERYAMPKDAVRDLELLAAGKAPESARILPSASTVATPAGLRSPSVRTKVGARPPTRGRLQKVQATAAAPRSSGMRFALAGVGVLVVGAVAAVAVLASRKDAPSRPPAADATETRAAAPMPAPVATPPGAPSGDLAERERRAREMLEVAARFARENPDRFEQAHGYFLKAREAGAGTAAEADAAAATLRLERRWDEEARKAFAGAAPKAKELAAGGDFDAALGAFAEIPDSLAPRVAARVEEERVLIEAAGRATIANHLAEAEARLAGGDAAAVRAELAKIPAVRFAKGVGEAADAVRALEEGIAEGRRAEGIAAAEKLRERTDAALAAFETLAERGDHAGALRRMEQESVTADDAGLSKTVKAAARVAAALAARDEAVRAAAAALVGGKVTLRTKSGPKKGEVERVTDEGLALVARMVINKEVKGETRFTVAWGDLEPGQVAELARSWQPADADGHAAAAYVALWAGDAKGMEAAIAASAGHALEARLRTKLDVVKMGAAGAAAKEAWEALAKRAAAKMITQAQAKALLDDLAAFEKQHGATDFAKSVAGELAEIKSRVEGMFELASLRVGLLGQWRFDEGKGPVAADSSGAGGRSSAPSQAALTAGNAGAIRGATWAEGKAGGALLFSGKGDHVDLTTASVAVQGNAARTLAAWVKTSAGGALTVLSTGSPARGQAFNLRMGNGIVGVMGWARDFYPRRGAAVNDGAWHHIAAVLSGDGTVTTYVDGARDNTARMTYATSGQENYIGRSNHVGFELYFAGLLDDVRIYGRALTPEEMSALAGAKSPAPAAGTLDAHVVGRWSFDEEAGPVARDSSRNGNHLRVRGGRRVEGVSGRAIRLNGTDAWAAAEGPKGLPSGAAPRSIAAWFRTRSLGRGHRNVGGYGAAEEGRSFQVSFINGRLTVQGRAAGHDWGTAFMGDDCADGRWHFVAVTYDGAETCVYVDGNRADRSTIYVFDTSPAKVVIGNEIDERGQEFEGDIDDFRIYDIALTLEQVREIAASAAEAAPAVAEAPEAPEVPEPPPEPAAQAAGMQDALLAALGDFEALVGKGEYAGARTYAEAAAKQPANAGLADDLRAAARAAAALEERQAAIRKRVEGLVGRTAALRTTGGVRRGDVKAVTDDGIAMVTTYKIGERTGETKHDIAWTQLTYEEQEKLADDWLAAGADAAAGRALLALAAGKADEARGLAAQAQDHAVGRFVLRRMEVENLGAAEVAAREAWRALAPLAAQRDVPEARAKRAAEALDSFVLMHGATEHAKSVAPEIDGLRRRLEMASGAGLVKGLVAWWRFDEGKGTVAADATGSGNDATLSGATWAQGKFGGALSFDGRTARAEVSTEKESVFGTLESFTIAAWIKADAAEGYRGIVSARHEGEVDHGGGNFVMQLTRGSPGFEANDLVVGNRWNAGVPVAGEWHHAAVVVRFGESIELFVDGRLAATQTEINRLAFTDQNRVIIGGRHFGGDYQAPFGGLIDDVRVYNRALGPDEVAALAGAKPSPAPKGAEAAPAGPGPAPQPVDEAAKPADDDAAAAAAGAAWPPKLDDLRRLFKGGVRAFRPKTLEIELLYDFTAPEQAGDFALGGWGARGRADGEMAVADGFLRMTGTRQCALHKAVFVSVAARAAVEVTGDPLDASLVVGADDRGNFYALGARGRFSTIFRTRTGLPAALTKGIVTSLGKSGRGTVAFSLVRGQLSGAVDNMKLETVVDPDPPPPGRVGFLAPNCDAKFGGLHVVGVLDRAWLEAALAAPGPADASPPPARAPAPR